MLYQGEELYKLMPQRDPIVMVDRILDTEGDVAHTGLAVTDRNYFIEDTCKSFAGSCISTACKECSLSCSIYRSAV